MIMLSSLLKVAALLGVAAYACDGPSYQQLHKRADSAIGTSDYDEIDTTTTNAINRMVLR